MEHAISNYSELMEFIKRDDVNCEFAGEVVQRFLNVLIVFDTDKSTLISDTKIHIDLHGGIPYDAEHPLFLSQKQLRDM